MVTINVIRFKKFGCINGNNFIKDCNKVFGNCMVTKILHNLKVWLHNMVTTLQRLIYQSQNSFY